MVGSVEILYLVFNGNLPWSDFIWPFALPTLAGNICGGTFIFALLSHAQIRNDMSSKRKAEAHAQAAEKGKKADRDIKKRPEWRGFKQSDGMALTQAGKNAILVPPCPLS